MMDIYFDKNYGKLYEKAEGGKAVCWKYSGEEGQISNQFILRKIPYDSGKEEWYDIVTPYGYGGPVIERISTSKEELIVAYEKAFGEYCRKNRIVSEFVRFHPIINNGADFQSIYNSQCIRHTVGTNLKAYDDPVTVEFSKKCRKNIRQALNKGVTWKITEIPDRLDGFREIYYSTMDRNNAGKYYYFDDEYFSNCLKWYKKQLLVVEAIYEKKTIAAGLCFISGNTIHIHLSGTLSEYLYLSPAYILRYAITIFGKKNGYEMIHHGGGRSNAEDDSLYIFKKQFGQNTLLDFYIGQKIWDQKMYDKICKIMDVDKDSGFFPAYRKKR